MGRPNILQPRQGYNTDNSLHVNRNNVFLNEKEPFPQISKVVRRINLLFLHFCKSLVSEKTGLKLNIQKMRIMASGPITSWQIDGETVETVAEFIFLGSKITVDGDCSHEIERRLLLVRAMTNLDCILKSRDITLPTKVRIVKATVFPVVRYGCETWTINKAEC